MQIIEPGPLVPIGLGLIRIPMSIGEIWDVGAAQKSAPPFRICRSIMPGLVVLWKSERATLRGIVTKINYEVYS